MSNKILSMKNVSKNYGNDSDVLKEINLEIDKGEFVFIIGESGAGKSTFLKLLYREEVASEGDIEVLGRKINEIKQNKIHTLRRDIGCVFQDFKLLENLTVYENISFVLEVVDCKKDQIESKVMEVLKLMKIDDKRDNFPNELSGGQQQRVAIARALVNKPELLICDEPTGNLDPATGEDIFKELLKINSEGTTVIMTTHNKDLVNKYRNRLIKLENGEIVFDEKDGEYGYEVESKVEPDAELEVEYETELNTESEVENGIREDVEMVAESEDEIGEKSDINVLNSNNNVEELTNDKADNNLEIEKGI